MRAPLEYAAIAVHNPAETGPGGRYRERTASLTGRLGRLVALLAIGGDLLQPVIEGGIIAETAELLERGTVGLGLVEVQPHEFDLGEIIPQALRDALQRGFVRCLLDPNAG